MRRNPKEEELNKEFIEFGVKVVLNGMLEHIKRIKEKMAKGQTITKKEQKLYDNWYKQKEV